MSHFTRAPGGDRRRVAVQESSAGQDTVRAAVREVPRTPERSPDGRDSSASPRLHGVLVGSRCNAQAYNSTSPRSPSKDSPAQRNTSPRDGKHTAVPSADSSPSRPPLRHPLAISADTAAAGAVTEPRLSLLVALQAQSPATWRRPSSASPSRAAAAGQPKRIVFADADSPEPHREARRHAHGPEVRNRRSDGFANLNAGSAAPLISRSPAAAPQGPSTQGGVIMMEGKGKGATAVEDQGTRYQQLVQLHEKFRKGQLSAVMSVTDPSSKIGTEKKSVFNLLRPDRPLTTTPLSRPPLAELSTSPTAPSSYRAYLVIPPVFASAIFGSPQPSEAGPSPTIERSIFATIGSHHRPVDDTKGHAVPRVEEEAYPAAVESRPVRDDVRDDALVIVQRRSRRLTSPSPAPFSSSPQKALTLTAPPETSPQPHHEAPPLTPAHDGGHLGFGPNHAPTTAMANNNNNIRSAHLDEAGARADIAADEAVARGELAVLQRLRLHACLTKLAAVERHKERALLEELDRLQMQQGQLQPPFATSNIADDGDEAAAASTPADARAMQHIMLSADAISQDTSWLLRSLPAISAVHLPDESESIGGFHEEEESVAALAAAENSAAARQRRARAHEDLATVALRKAAATAAHAWALQDAQEEEAAARAVIAAASSHAAAAARQRHRIVLTALARLEEHSATESDARASLVDVFERTARALRRTANRMPPPLAPLAPPSPAASDSVVRLDASHTPPVRSRSRLMAPVMTPAHAPDVKPEPAPVAVANAPLTVNDLSISTIDSTTVGSDRSVASREGEGAVPAPTSQPTASRPHHPSPPRKPNTTPTARQTPDRRSSPAQRRPQAAAAAATTARSQTRAAGPSPSSKAAAAKDAKVVIVQKTLAQRLRDDEIWARLRDGRSSVVRRTDNNSSTQTDLLAPTPPRRAQTPLARHPWGSSASLRRGGSDRSHSTPRKQLFAPTPSPATGASLRSGAHPPPTASIAVDTTDLRTVMSPNVWRRLTGFPPADVSEAPSHLTPVDALSPLPNTMIQRPAPERGGAGGLPAESVLVSLSPVTVDDANDDRGSMHGDDGAALVPPAFAIATPSPEPQRRQSSRAAPALAMSPDTPELFRYAEDVHMQQYRDLMTSRSAQHMLRLQKDAEAMRLQRTTSGGQNAAADTSTVSVDHPQPVDSFVYYSERSAERGQERRRSAARAASTEPVDPLPPVPSAIARAGGGRTVRGRRPSLPTAEQRPPTRILSSIALEESTYVESASDGAGPTPTRPPWKQQRPLVTPSDQSRFRERLHVSSSDSDSPERAPPTTHEPIDTSVPVRRRGSKRREAVAGRRSAAADWAFRSPVPERVRSHTTPPEPANAHGTAGPQPPRVRSHTEPRTGSHRTHLYMPAPTTTSSSGAKGASRLHQLTASSRTKAIPAGRARQYMFGPAPTEAPAAPTAAPNRRTTTPTSLLAARPTEASRRRQLLQPAHGRHQGPALRDLHPAAAAGGRGVSSAVASQPNARRGRYVDVFLKQRLQGGEISDAAEGPPPPAGQVPLSSSPARVAPEPTVPGPATPPRAARLAVPHPAGTTVGTTSPAARTAALAPKAVKALKSGPPLSAKPKPGEGPLPHGLSKHPSERTGLLSERRLSQLEREALRRYESTLSGRGGSGSKTALTGTATAPTRAR